MPATLRKTKKMQKKETDLFEDIGSLIGRVYNKLFVSDMIVHNSAHKAHKSRNKRHKR